MGGGKEGKGKRTVGERVSDKGREGKGKDTGRRMGGGRE